MFDGNPYSSPTRTPYCWLRWTRQKIRKLFEDLSAVLKKGNGLNIDCVDRKFCYTVRERTMIALINELTDTTEWQRKVFAPEYTFKWKSGLVMSGRDITRSMADWVG